MTGAAQISSTKNILRRPRVVRWASSSSRGPGSACTVRSSGWSRGPGCAAAGEDELEPGIEEGDQAAQGPPLEGIAVIGFGSATAGFGPLAAQALGGGPGLLHRHVGQQLQTRFGRKRWQVEILPDGPGPGRAELVKLGRGRGNAPLQLDFAGRC